MSIRSFQDQLSIDASLRGMEKAILDCLALMASMPDVYDRRWVCLARDNIEIGYMAARRALYSHDATKVKEGKRNA